MVHIVVCNKIYVCNYVARVLNACIIFIWMKIIAVIYATFRVAKRRPEKNSGLYGIRTLDLCDTGATLYQLS